MSARRRTAALVLLTLVAFGQVGLPAASAAPAPVLKAGPGHCC